MSIRTNILVFLILAFVGIIPVWSHSQNWGYAPGGGVGLILTVFVVLLLFGSI